MKEFLSFFLLSLLTLSISQPIETHVSYFLAPQSDVAFSSFNKNLELIVEEDKQLKKKILSANTQIKSTDVSQHIERLGKIKPQNREEYILIRGMIAWWEFHEPDIQAVVLGDYATPLLNAYNGLESRFEALFSEALRNSYPHNYPVWDEEAFSFQEGENDYFQSVFTDALEEKDFVNEWLVEEGRLAKVLHLVHGIPFRELEEAFENKQVLVTAFPKGHGDYKYVLKLAVQVGEKTYYLALKRVYVTLEEQTEEAVEREIAATNMNHQFGLPLIGSFSIEERIWLDEYILGYDLDDFVLKLALEYGFSSEKIIETWKQIQIASAKEFILLYLRGFSGLYYVDDPHTGNVMAYWPLLQEHQVDPDRLDLEEIKLTLMDIGSLRSSFSSIETLPINTTVVDVGRVSPAKQSLISSFFRTTYNLLFIESQKEVLSLLPQVDFADPPTRMELAAAILEELSAAEKIHFVSALLQGLPQEVKMLEKTISNAKMLRNEHRIPEYEKTIEELDDLYNTLFDLVLDEVKDLVDESILFAESVALKEGKSSYFGLIKRWQTALALSQEVNNELLFKTVNSFLKDLSEEASFPLIRQFAAKQYQQRTGLTLKIELSAPERLPEFSL